VLHNLRADRGAAAVEFALVAPVLILLVVGIVEYGRAYGIQNSLTAAARESVRVVALSPGPTVDVNKAINAAIYAAPEISPNLTSSNVAVPTTCPVGTNATVTITYTFTMLTGLLGPNLTMTGTGVMRCGG
jgi:Flp pilus assembly protein TadG